jgi:hypothetical protein
VEGREEIVVALGPGLEADEGSWRGVRVFCRACSEDWGERSCGGGERGGEAMPPLVGETECPMSPY